MNAYNVLIHKFVRKCETWKALLTRDSYKMLHLVKLIASNL